MARKLKFKTNNWLDTSTMQIRYGIDAFYDGAWYHCSDGGKPLFFDTVEERDEKLKELVLGEKNG